MTNKTEGGYRTTSVGSVGNYFEDQGLAPSIISFLFPLSISGLFYSFLNYYTRIKWKYIQSSRSHVRRVLWQFVFCFFFPIMDLKSLPERRHSPRVPVWSLGRMCRQWEKVVWAVVANGTPVADPGTPGTRIAPASRVPPSSSSARWKLQKKKIQIKNFSLLTTSTYLDLICVYIFYFLSCKSIT